jgi:hypothetical protein
MPSPPETVPEPSVDDYTSNPALIPTADQIAQIANPEVLIAAIANLANSDQPITGTQAIAILANPAIAELPQAAIEQVFANITPEALSTEEVTALTTELNVAPPNVKKAFEKTINIFGGVFNNYIPTGSSIPVHARRTLIAAGAVISFLPSPQPTVRRKK